jgi:hypothetical protein
MKTWMKIGAGAVVMFGLGMFAQKLVPQAQAGAGLWQCYVVDRFPDMKAAAEWKGAVNYTTALNQVAPATTAGTVMMATYPVSAMGGSQVGGAPIVCVKE